MYLAIVPTGKNSLLHMHNLNGVGYSLMDGFCATAEDDFVNVVAVHPFPAIGSLHSIYPLDRFLNGFHLLEKKRVGLIHQNAGTHLPNLSTRSTACFHVSRYVSYHSNRSLRLRKD